MAGFVKQGVHRDLGPGIYQYWCRRLEDEDDRFSVWVHQVYGRVSFLALTIPLDRLLVSGR
jgi:hypothetical protein